MATQPQQPDNTLPLPPGVAEESKAKKKEIIILPGQPADAKVPEHGMAQPTEDQTKYWERVLSDQGLSMERGAANSRVSQADRRRRVVPVGDGNDLEKIPQTRRGRRVRPDGHGPDTD